MARTLILLWLCGSLPAAAGGTYRWRSLAPPQGAVVGCSVVGRTLATWGDRIALRTLPDGRPHTRELPAGLHFGEGGALLDVDGDGRLDLVLEETAPPALAWYRAPEWTRHIIDEGADTPDLLPATLFGRRGVVGIHRRMQVRFYEIPPDAARPWTAHDLYSVYTPSWQGGLAIADVDGDGRPDLFCGNYWIRAPERFEWPWRLFAINTWTEKEPSGMMRLGWDGIFASAQRLLGDGRAAWFERPADPRQMWPAHDLGRFDHANSLEVVDLDGDGHPEIVLAENGGAGRVMLFRGPGFRAEELRRGSPVRWLRVVGGRDLLLITAAGMEYGSLVR